MYHSATCASDIYMKKKLYTKKYSSGSGMVNMRSKYASDIYLEIYDERQKGGDDTEDALSL